MVLAIMKHPRNSNRATKSNQLFENNSATCFVFKKHIFTDIIEESYLFLEYVILMEKLKLCRFFLKEVPFTT